MIWVQFFSIAAFVIAVAAMIAKALRYASAPASLRWELYPVPHEKGRSEYGGSYLEELDWWTKKRQGDTLREFREMFEEIILLKGVYHNNRKVWAFSFPFHLGLYICIGWLLLLLAGAVLEAVGLPVVSGAGYLGTTVHYLTVISGYAGLILAGFGALGLFIWRATDARQRPYNAPIEYFNLIFFVVLVVVVLTAHITGDSQFVFLRGYVESLITLQAISIPTTLLTVELVLMSLMIMYIPLTRMSHFVAKYFLYHAVRWNDEPIEKGSRLEQSLMANLKKFRINWSAEHMRGGRSWAEAVTDSPEKNDEQ